MDFVKTSIEVFGFTIMEPVTVVTDFLVSCVCFYAYRKLAVANDGFSSSRLLKYYFLLLAMGTFYGGLIGHGLQHLVTFTWKLPGWLISMASVALIERAAILHARPLLKPAVGNFFSILNIIEFISLVVIVLLTLDFFYVEAHAAYGLLVIVFSFELFIFIKTKSKGSLMMLAAVGVSTMAATVHLSKFILHDWFNHLDLGHVLMAIAAYLFYLGAARIKLPAS